MNKDNKRWMRKMLEPKPRPEQPGIQGPPRKVHVFLVNDLITPYYVILAMLEKVFRLTNLEANEILWKSHAEGQAFVRSYTVDVADTLITLARIKSKPHPLQFVTTSEKSQ